MATLTAEIDKVWLAEYENVPLDQKQDGYQAAYSMTECEVNERDWLIDKPLRRKAERYGIAIHPEDFDHASWGGRSTLTYSARTRLRREVRDYRRNAAKDWAAIITPVMTLLVAILGLVVAIIKR